MKILLASAHPYIPQISGGAQSNTHELAMEFIRRGHETAVLSGLTGDGWLGKSARLKLKFGRAGFVQDDGLGYPVFRSWFAWEAMTEVVRRFGADVVVMQSGFPVKLAQALDGIDVRRLIYLHNVEIDDLGDDLGGLTDMAYIANSHFTADRFATLFGLKAPVVYPLIPRENYETDSTRENVTFINPHPLKGVDIALEVAARCPEIPFRFVRAWTLSPDDLERLTRRARELNNVVISPATRDMKAIYGAARIVLAPSRWDEAFGRVAAEAHCSGIPVVGSNRGGLPEAIGPGGLIVDPDASSDTWAETVRSLWHDETLWQEKSAAARAYSRRPEMDPNEQIRSLIQIFEMAPASAKAQAL